jgi:hypothetical protein
LAIAVREPTEAARPAATSIGFAFPIAALAFVVTEWRM